MKSAAHTAGASVVGRLTDITPCEAELIMSMRFWMEGPEGQAEVWNGFARCFGATEGRAQMRSFESLLSILCTHARRPLVRHGLGCNCIGSDEAILQTLVREATRGDLAEAAMIASLIVPARHAEPVALMAAEVGQAMQRMSQRTPYQPPHRTDSEDRILHLTNTQARSALPPETPARSSCQKFPAPASASASSSAKAIVSVAR